MNRIIYEDIRDIIASECVDWKRFDKKTVLIAGATGMLPSYMALTLLGLSRAKRIEVKVILLVSNLQKARKVFEDYLDLESLSFIVQDVSAPVEVESEVDFIIHAASQASPKCYGTDPVGTLNANVLGTHNLLELAKRKHAEGFLFFSTGGVYGNFATEDIVITENMYGSIDPLHVRSCYFESKRMAENMCACYAYQYGVPVKIIRIFHTLGPNVDINDGRAFSDFCKAIIEGKDIVLRSDGSAMRTFCYAADAVKGYFMVLLNGKSGEAYNVGSTDNEISMRDLAEMLVGLYPEKKLSVRYEIDPGSVTYTKMRNAVNRAIPSTDKIKSLGWSETADIPTIFRRTIDSHIAE